MLLIRGYGPLVGLVVFFAAVALLAPTVTPADEGAPAGAEGAAGTQSSSPQGGAGAGEAPGGPSVGDDGAPPDGAADDTAAPGAADGEDTAAADDPGGESADGGSGDAGEARAATGETGACEERELQVPGDPYSPPCVTFGGENPGATHRGVTEDAVIISARTPDEPGFVDELANLADADIADSQADVRRTISALEQYFNERFEFYGRELRFEFFDGAGNFQEEAQDRGHEQARRDALTVADEIGAFGELTGSTYPFSDALAGEGVLSFSGIHFPRGYHVERRPYKWSTFTDCSTVVEAAAEWTVQRLYGRKAVHAGPEFQDRERSVMAVGPENPIYQACVDDAARVYESMGAPLPEVINYTLDIPSMSNQAANIIAQLQEREVTTVQAFVDPVMAIFLTSRAEEQGYEPEWIISGAAYMDRDIMGQLQDQQQWSRTFGISFAGETVPQQGTLGYHAYKQIRDDEPAQSVDQIYASMYLVALGVQGAGPNLTPETFEQGMFDYPGGNGPYGTWHFGPKNYTATQDFREIYWDPEETSVYNKEPGAYVATDPGTRLRRGEIPEGPPRLP